MSQERMDSAGVSANRTPTSYTSPDIGDTLNRVNNTMRKCRVVHGANEGYFEIEGKNVGQVRKSLRDVFSIPSDAVALIDGKTVQDDFIMEAGQQLEFNKEAGTKGTEVDMAIPACRQDKKGVLTREEVYQLVDGERAYQDKLPPSRTDGSSKTVGDYLTMMRSYMTKAEFAWTDNNGNAPALDVVRKIAGIAVRCMEDHGAPARTP